MRDGGTSCTPRTRRADLQDWPGPRHLSRGAGILAQAGITPCRTSVAEAVTANLAPANTSGSPSNARVAAQ
ncbi:hypothetical protein CPT_Mana_023 [Burkholderia phage Mana]|uniref:Uncharacterized protein n=1 Tax=Burkholderia phage Mana TaxID=2767578 RepID=A0A873WH27_9CAUD|nr:hypothetical protein KNV21_gp23 [Burkholderia phage Mana]QPB09418.1 hypothetical protein CPT_Mana_023 [Burkholderia phage Mana]